LSVAGLEVAHLLAGAGAVANAHLLTLATAPGLTGAIDVFDYDTVDTTNRNRCVLFFEGDVDATKTDVVKRVLSGGSVTVRPHHERAEAGIRPASTVVSAVDTPESRAAIQARYPRRVMQGSTKNLRVELLRCDPTHATACLRCYQQPRNTDLSDDALRVQLAALPDAELQRKVSDISGDPDALREWIDTGLCSSVAGEMLAHFRRSDDEQEFAVGFVSALAGVLLAAQTVKEALAGAAGAGAPLRAAMSRARFTLLDLGAATSGAGPYARDDRCPMCVPGSPAMEVWSTRYRS
jgi:hypothetical protein